MNPIDATEFLKVVNYITALVPVFMALAGWGSLVAILINLGKTIGLIKDGVAPKVNLVLNLAGFVVLAGLGLFNLITPEYFDQVAGAVAAMLTAVIGLVTAYGAAAKTHGILSGAGLPVIGKSYSAAKK
jgi:hypothetical protein